MMRRPPSPPLFPSPPLSRSLAHLERVRLGCEQRAEPAEGMALPLQILDGELGGRRERRQHCCPECGVAGLRQVEPGKLHQRRSEEHTSELQSQSNLVCRLLL